MHPQLQEYQDAFRSIQTEAEALLEDVDEAAMNQRPAPDAWSAVQCIDHLNMAGWELLAQLEDVIAEARESGPYGEPPFHYGWFSRWFVNAMKPTSSYRFPAPSSIQPEPADRLPAAETLHEFISLQDNLSRCVSQTKGLDLRAIRVASPILPIMRLSLGAWFESTAAHERRHLQQAYAALGIE